MPRSKSIPDTEVLAATRRALLDHGPNGLTLSRVAGICGLSAATLVQRFGSKRGLMLAFAQREAEAATAPFLAARVEHEGALDALRAALVSVSKSTGGDTKSIAHSLAVLIDDITDPDLRAAAGQHVKATEQAITSLLDDAKTEGSLPADTDTAKLALSIQAAHNGAIIQWALRGEEPFAPFLDRVLAPLLPQPEES